MATIATAFKEVFSAADQERPDRQQRPVPTSLSHTTTLDDRGNGNEIHCYEPWIIGQYLEGRHRRAERSLIRDGWEAFYPAGRKIDYLPQNQIPPKKRHRKGYFLRLDLRLPYPGYVFLRRIVPGGTPLTELWKLDGMQGVCMFGEEVATIPDFRIEMMRIHQDAGDYDQYDDRISAKVYRLAEIKVTEAAKDRWSEKPRSLGKLDTNQGSIHFIEEFGRITRVVTQNGDKYIQR